MVHLRKISGRQNRISENDKKMSSEKRWQRQEVWDEENE